MLKRICLGALLAGCLAGTVLAQDEVVIDYATDPLADVVMIEQWDHIARQMTGDVVVLGEASGAFSAPGTDEKAYLASKGPVSIDPFADLDQRIAVFSGDEHTIDWTIMPKNIQFNRVIRSVDVDGDGLDEILLEFSHYNMGTLEIGVGLARIGEMPELLQTLPGVYVDSCEASVGEKRITASTISVADGKLVAEEQTLPC